MTYQSPGLSRSSFLSATGRVLVFVGFVRGRCLSRLFGDLGFWRFGFVDRCGLDGLDGLLASAESSVCDSTPSTSTVSSATVSSPSNVVTLSVLSQIPDQVPNTSDTSRASPRSAPEISATMNTRKTSTTVV